MNSLRKLCIFVFWSIVGATIIEIELYIHNLIFEYIIFTKAFMVIIPVTLYCLLNLHNKILIKKNFFVSKYYIKSIIFMYTGLSIRHVYYYFTDDQLGVTISIITCTILFVFMLCFRFIQKKYEKLCNKEIYWWYIVLGTTLSVYFASVVSNDSPFYTFSDDPIRFFLMLLLVIIINVYKYSKYNKHYMIKENIGMRVYCSNAVKMTMIPFILFVIPFSILFCLP